ncbi:MAG TPA: rhodanese-like domain-containing protein [Bdellovibrionota bacterium]|jgi:hydroxyacylglutathione hydrolase|nr:rhodanese-like domain-containing protein [Bdellovibrionota bacterium]
MGYFKNTTVNGEGVLDVSVKDVFEGRADVKLIDVRRPDEWVGELGHIEGSTLMTLETDFAQGIRGEDHEQTIVFVCRSGARSSRAAAFARALGFVDVYNMQGGMIAWNDQRLPISK